MTLDMKTSFTAAAFIVVGALVVGMRHDQTTPSQELSCAAHDISSRTPPRSGLGNFIAGQFSFCP